MQQFTTKQIVACASYLGLSSCIGISAGICAYEPPPTKENVIESIAVGTSAFLVWPFFAPYALMCPFLIIQERSFKAYDYTKDD